MKLLSFYFKSISMKKLYVYSTLMLLILSSCSHKILQQEVSSQEVSSDNKLNEKLVDRTRKIFMTTSNDNAGIFVNIRIPDQYDQYKVLKFGGQLSINLHNSNHADYKVNYPLNNTNEELFLPAISFTDTSFHMGKLLSDLGTESTKMNLTNFYNINRAGIASNLTDNIAVKVYTDQNRFHELIYSAFIPYNSMNEFGSAIKKGTTIRIGFESGFLKVRHSDRAPGFNPNPYLPYKDARKNANPQLDPRILSTLSAPIQFWTEVELSKTNAVQLSSR